MNKTDSKRDANMLRETPLITAEGILTGVDQYKATVDIKAKDFTFESMIHIPDDQIADRASIGAMIGRRVRIEVHLVDDGDGEAQADGQVNHTPVSIDQQLIEAARRNDIDSVDRLLSSGVTQNSDNHHALHTAAINGYIHVLNRLIEAGFDPKANGHWAFICSSAFGHMTIVNRLLEFSPDIKAINEAIELATKYGQTAMVERLKQHIQSMESHEHQ